MPFQASRIGVIVAAATLAGVLSAGWCPAAVPATAPTASADLPVGYDHPESDRGGPRAGDGLGWIDRVWPRALVFAPGKLAGGTPTVMFITNFSVLDKLHALRARMPLDAVVVAPEGGNDFPGREAFQKALASRPRFDCFLLCRVNAKTIPVDVQYEILRRVKEDGAGLLILDVFDMCETLTSGFLGLKPAEKGPEALTGIPHEGLREWDCTKATEYQTYNFWYGQLASDPRERPRTSGELWVAPFGKGRVVGFSTNSHWQRMYYARTLLPQINLRRDMWVENDYAYSATAKAILKAAGRVPAVQVKELRLPGKDAAAAEPIAILAQAGGLAFKGKLFWQFRDTWGQVSDKGELALDLPAGKEAHATVLGAFLRDAGRRFLDVRIEDAAGATVDWASVFAVVDRSSFASQGVPAPVITCRHPDGFPRGAPLAGEIKAVGAPPGSTIRAALVDRHWRQVGLATGPTNAPMAWNFPSAGLDGQIWLVLADVLDAKGRVLAQAHLTVTSPHTPATLPGFTPVMTSLSGTDPESAGWNEFLRHVGFTCNRPYSAGSAMLGEASAWNDVQLLPFFCAVTSGSWDYKQDQIADWEDPHRQKELREGAAFMAGQLKPFGHRGFNLTDDASAAAELPPGPYTARAFHEWLRREYGSAEAAKKAWGWQDEFGQLAEPADELPYDPYVAIAFHDWLKAKYGTLAAVAKAWGLKPATVGFGFLHVFGAIQREMIADQTKAGNAAPAADAKRFMAEDAKRPGKAANPFAAFHHASIKKAHAAKCFAPWIDAKRFCQERWVQYMLWVKDGAAGVNPQLAVGSDASFYAQALCDVFGQVDYVAPYYNDREVKVAVSRGRARRPGIYGACLGSYGPKPPDCSGRRSQVWDILFAGGTGFYYWMFNGGAGGGLNADLTVSDAHGRYQLEATEEIMNGPGELFTGCRRIFDRVAILDSQTSGICDELDKQGEPITSQAGSAEAFQAVFEDMGLNPHTITAAELAGGWLTKNGTRLLALPGASSMSDAEIAAVAAFVKAGGVVVADIRPGGRRPNGTPRPAVALDEVFGIAYDSAGAVRRVRGAITPAADAAGATPVNVAEALADPRVTPTTAKPTGLLDKTPVVLANRHGQGQALLLNASFATYATYRSEGGPVWRPWYDVMKWVTASAGQKRLFALTSMGQETPGFELSPFRNGPGYLLGVEDLGCGDFVGPRRPFVIKLPGTFNIYEIRSGRSLRAGDTIAEDIPRNGHRAYFLAPYSVAGLSLKAKTDRELASVTIRLSVDLRTAGPAIKRRERCLHVIRLEARTPAGESFWPFRRVLRMPAAEPLELELTTSPSDPRGVWIFTATDVNTAATATTKVTLE